jgi:uncharacterized protein YukE
MAGDMQGMDVEYARQSANRMDGGAGAVSDLVRQVSSMLDSVVWTGADAQRFHQDWHGQFMPQLQGATDALQQNSAVLKRRADLQEQASQG